MTTTLAATSARVDLDRLIARQAELRQALHVIDFAGDHADTPEQHAAVKLEHAAARLHLSTVERLVIRARARVYLERINADPEHLDHVDAVMWMVNEAGRSWTASEVGRVLGIDTSTAATALAELETTGDIKGDARGARTRWTAR